MSLGGSGTCQAGNGLTSVRIKRWFVNLLFFQEEVKIIKEGETLPHIQSVRLSLSSIVLEKDSPHHICTSVASNPLQDKH